MSKEMFISSSPHETKVAVLEDDQLVEVYFERDTDVGLVGGIYKGRVSRVLPGMQSAFVDIGLDRDAFLYVSDFFFEDQEEYDKVFDEAEARASKFTAQAGQVQESQAAPPIEVPAVQPEAVEPPASAPPATVPAEPVERPAVTEGSRPHGSNGGSSASSEERGSYDRRPFDPRRGRRRRHRGGRPDFREHRHEGRRFTPAPRAEEPDSAPHAFEILPGESLAKYRHAAPPSASEEGSATPEALGPEAVGVETIAEAQETAAAFVPESERSSRSEISGHDVPTPLGGQLEESPAPAGEATVAAPLTPEAEMDAQAPAAAVTAVVTDTVARFAPEAERATEASPERAATGEGVRAPYAPPKATLTSAAPAPSVESVEAAPEPSSSAEIAAPAETIGEASATETTASSDEIAEPAAAWPAAEAESPSERAENGDLDDEAEDEEEEDEEEEEEDEEEEGEDELEVETGITNGQNLSAESSGGEPSGQPAATEAAEGVATAPSDAPGDRSYTLREPHQRPRFAPRRRRGRRGTGPRRSERPRESRSGNHQPMQISEMLKEGQEILVQIAKEPLGTKGARITSHVALPGRYLVYMPTIEHIGVSRKIASEEERLRLRNLILENKGSLTGGFIVRTAGQGRTDEEFKADLKFLSTLWADIRAKADRLRAPALLHRDLDLVQRLLRDLLTPDFKSVRVDNEIDFERVLEFVNRCQPGLIGKVKLYTRDTPMYEEFGIQQELDKALKPKVWLKSGGYIVINQTEALVAIDINTGKFVGKTNRLEDTIVKTNIDAVNEIVRQVRLRDLGGIIVIDFIDMDERKNRAKVVQALEEALRSDRAPTKVISFHDFGLVAVTRKRVKQSLERTLCEPCQYCSGAGWVKSVHTVCNEILAEARKMAKQIDGDVITLRVNTEVAKALKSREGSLVNELESLTKKDVIIKGDPQVHQERFEIF